MSLNIIMISDEMIKQRTAIHGNIDPQLIKPDIKVAQDIYILPILGTALYDKILTDINAGNIAGTYKSLLDNYILDTLMWYVLAELPMTLSFQFWNKGVIRKQGVDTELPSMNELNDLRNYYKNRAEHYATRLRLYLRQTATATVLPEYLSPGNNIDTVHPVNNTFHMPIYLGHGDCGSRSFEEKYQGNNSSC